MGNLEELEQSIRICGEEIMALFTDVFVDVTKLGRKIPTTEYLDSGLHPIFDQGQNTVAGYTNETDGLFLDVPAIIFGDHTRVLKYIDTPCFLGADGVKLLKVRIANPNYRYLYYALCHADIPNTGYNRHFKWLKEVEIPIPSEDEQQQIVSVLDIASSVINLRKRQLTELDVLVKARFIEMFGDQKTNPFGWEQCTIGKCCTLKSGTSLPSEVENEGGPIPYIKVGDMNYPGNERYITTSSRYVSEATAGKGLFEVGSILFPKRGGAIGTNKKRMTTLPVCADLNVMGVSSKGRLRPKYLMAYFDMIDLGALSDGSSVPQINNKNITPLVICIPPLELQEQFAAFVEQVDKSKAAVQKALDEAQTLFDSLMQQYFG